MEFSNMLFFMANASVFYLILFFNSAFASGNYEQRLISKAKISEEEPLRMGKLNTLWKKAKQIVKDESDLANLYGDLLIQDNMEMKFKKEKLANLDMDKEQEYSLRNKLLDILEKYKIKNLWKDKFDDDSTNEVMYSYDLSQIKDKKLLKIWEEANSIGFSENDIISLKKEFSIYLEKKEQYNILKRKLQLLLDSNSESTQVNKELKLKHEELKKLLKNVESLFNKYRGFGVDGNPSDILSTDKVSYLWNSALNANLSKEDLSLFKNDIEKFKKKLQKQEFYIKEAELSKIKQSDQDYNSNQKENYYNFFSNKIKEHTQQVNKWYQELKNKLASKIVHTDL